MSEQIDQARGLFRARVHDAIRNATLSYRSPDLQLYRNLASDLEAFSIEMRSHAAHAADNPSTHKNTRLKGL